MSMIIRYVPSPTASGKTHQLIDRAIKLGNAGEKVLLVQPTRDLIIETEKKLRYRGIGLRIRAIFKKEGPDAEIQETTTVLSRVQSHLAEPYPDGQVLVITWKTFLALPFIPHRADWNVLVDEVPDVLHTYRQVFSDTYFIITDSLKVTPQGAEYGILSAVSGGKLRAIADNEHKDAGYNLFKELAGRIVSGHYDNYVRMRSYRSLIKGNGHTSELTVWSLLKPTILKGFKSVLIAGARIEESLLFKLWGHHNVNFVLDQAMVDLLRYSEHTNGSLITIYYGVEQPWSKWTRKQDGERVRKDIIEWIGDKLEGQPFIWLENEDRVSTSPFGQMPGQERLPHKSHGLNRFATYHNVAILSAYNYDPETAKFLTDVARIGRYEQRDAFAHQTIYQSVCRCSIRDLDNIHPKMVFVADRACAEWLQARFPGSTVHSMGIVPVARQAPGRPKRHNSDNDRKTAHRQNRIKKLLSDVATHSTGLMSTDLAASFPECDETTLYLISNNVSLLKGTILARKYDKVGIPLVYTDAEFISYLKVRSKKRYGNKDDNALISPAIFDPNKTERGSRTLDNVVTANGLWFDVEGGNLAYQEWARIFPHINVIAYNTYSHTKKNPRYRICFPTKTVMTSEAYKELWHQVKQVIVNEGYELDKVDPARPNIKAHGIDNKFNPSDMFFLPCQAREAKDSFFKVWSGGDRKPLDVVAWLENPVPTQLSQSGVKDMAKTEIVTTEGLTDAQISEREAALEEWEKTGRLPGKGHEALFKLKLRCKRAGLVGHDLESVLRYAASNSNTPSDRLRDVRLLMRK